MPGPLQDALALDIGPCAHHDHDIHASVAAGLQQQRHLEHRHGGPAHLLGGRNVRSASNTSGWMMASTRLKPAGSARAAAASLARSTPAGPVVPGKAASISGAAAPA